MTRARLLAEADSRELSGWAAFYRVEAEDEAAARAAGTSRPIMAGLA